MFKRLKSSQGVTIIELMIALAIFGLVISVAFSIQSYGIASFSRGESLVTRQQNMRMVTRILSEEVRFAREVVVVDSQTDPGYVYFWADDGSILKRTEAETEIILSSTKNTSYSLEFNVTPKEGEDEKDPRIVEITVRSESPQGVYEVTTSVKGLNLPIEGIEKTGVGPVLGIKPLE